MHRPITDTLRHIGGGVFIDPPATNSPNWSPPSMRPASKVTSS